MSDKSIYALQEGLKALARFVKPHVPLRLAFKDRAQGDAVKAYDAHMADWLTAYTKRFNRRFTGARR